MNALRDGPAAEALGSLAAQYLNTSAKLSPDRAARAADGLDLLRLRIPFQ